MGNYMIMLENHLTLAQNHALARVQEVAADQGVNLFVTGSGIRDMIAGFPVQDLEFVVEGNFLKFARAVAAKGGAHIASTDEALKLAVVTFDSAARATVALARQERFPKPGGKPHITPATIHEHLRSRDFTVNSIALSLSRASRGLLIDPNNGVSDLQTRELRTIGNYAFYDQPIRMLQLFRLRARLGFTVAEKTWSQYRNAREARMERHIRPDVLFRELQKVAREPNPLDVLQAWDAEGLLERVLPAVSGTRLNAAGFLRLQKARQAIPFRGDVPMDDAALFYWILTEKLTPRERSEFVQALGMEKETVESWQKLEARALKLEKELAVSGVVKPSHIFRVLSKAPPEQSIFLLMKSNHRAAQERIRNYFSKYLPVSLEVTERDLPGLTPGTPKFEKARAELIARRLDARPKRAPVETESASAAAHAAR